jgi:hypothetical protein
VRPPHEEERPAATPDALDTRPASPSEHAECDTPLRGRQAGVVDLLIGDARIDGRVLQIASAGLRRDLARIRELVDDVLEGKVDVDLGVALIMRRARSAEDYSDVIHRRLAS